MDPVKFMIKNALDLFPIATLQGQDDDSKFYLASPVD
jgi:hypothetical protein